MCQIETVKLREVTVIMCENVSRLRSFIEKLDARMQVSDPFEILTHF